MNKNVKLTKLLREAFWLGFVAGVKSAHKEEAEKDPKDIVYRLHQAVQLFKTNEQNKN